MTPKQQRFVDEYLIDLNATQAAIRAGYAKSGARTEGARLLADANIAAEIDEAMAKRSMRTNITQDQVLRELARIGFVDIRKVVTWTNGASGFDEAMAEETGEVRISVANFVSLVPSDQIDAETAAAISEVSQTKDGALKVKLHDKRAALVDLGRHLGMFKDKVEVTGKDGGAIEIDQVRHDADAFTRSIVGIAARSGTPGGTGKTKH
jgi:phage terminase small subunit